MENLHLLSIPLEISSSISHSIYGNFTSAKAQEVAVVQGNSLTILSLGDEENPILPIASEPAMGNIRSIAPLRLTGMTTDMIALTSDSGKLSIVVLDKSTDGQWFLRVDNGAILGRSGLRRHVPGERVTVDPKGRALFVTSLASARYAYIVSRNTITTIESNAASAVVSNQPFADSIITLSSPLDASVSDNYLTYDVVSLDVGFSNPIFAILEVNLTELNEEKTNKVEKKVNFYEIDLGVNHIILKNTLKVSRHANKLIQVPYSEGKFPGGLIVCSENSLSYYNIMNEKDLNTNNNEINLNNIKEIELILPRRHNLVLKKNILIINSILFKQKDSFFYILQNELGDLFKLTFTISNDGKDVLDMTLSYLDTILPCSGLNLTKNGLLFCSTEYNNNYLLQFNNLSSNLLYNVTSSSSSKNSSLVTKKKSALKYLINTKLVNLNIISTSPSLSPLIDVVINDYFHEDIKQLYTFSGVKNASTYRILRHGVSVKEIIKTELAYKPLSLWIIKKNITDPYDSYIIITYANNLTIIYTINNDNIKELTQDIGILTNVTTLQVSLLEDNAIIQVYSHGIRHIRTDNNRTSEWKPPGKRTILHASVNSSQVAISLTGGEIIYFELGQSGQLMEMGSIDLGKEICCLNLESSSKKRSNFLIVGCWDDSCQLLSLNHSEILSKGPSFHTESRPISLCLIQMYVDSPLSSSTTSSSTTLSTNTPSSPSSALFLYVGLEKGVMMRLKIDENTGDFLDKREKFLGTKPIKLCPIKNLLHSNNGNFLLALSSRNWYCYTLSYKNYNYDQVPLSYLPLDFTTNLSCESFPNALIGLSGNQLCIFTIDNYNGLFNQQSFSLKYTPKKVVEFPSNFSSTSPTSLLGTVPTTSYNLPNKFVCLIESNQNQYNESELKKVNKQFEEEKVRLENEAIQKKNEIKMEDDGREEGEDNEEEEDTLDIIQDPLPGQPGCWSSCLRVLNLINGETLALKELEPNEAALSVQTVVFSSHSEERFIVVGSAFDLIQSPVRSFSSCFISVYRLLPNPSASSSSSAPLFDLQLLHRTEVEDLPYCLEEFNGRLLASVGHVLRLYELGKKKLLKKIENSIITTDPILKIIVLPSNCDRILISDLSQSIYYIKFNQLNHSFGVFAEDKQIKFITSLCLIDNNTVACGDKFGNFFILRLSNNINDNINVRTGVIASSQSTSLTSVNTSLSKSLKTMEEAPYKFELINHYYLNDIPMKIIRTKLNNYQQEVIIICTLKGNLYLMKPLINKEEIFFYSTLESFMRDSYTNICQRDQLSYRSLYQPVKNVYDYNLCESFKKLKKDVQLNFLKRNQFSSRYQLQDVIKKIEEAKDFL